MTELAAEVIGNNIYNRVIKAKEAMTVALGIVLTDLLAHREASMQAGSDIVQHAEKAFPSAFATPNIGADVLGVHDYAIGKAIDIPAEAIPAAASVALLRNAPEKTSLKELAGMFVAAQGLAVSGDAALAQEHVLSQTERHTQDNGFSAVYLAFFSKLVFDKIGRTENARLRHIRQALAGAAAGALIIGTSFIDRDNLWTDIVSHTAGVLTGAGGSALRQRDKPSNAEPLIQP